MINLKNQEIWKEFPLNIEFEGNYRIEVSNLGNLRTYNSHFPEGNEVKGSIQNGYKCLRFTLFKERSVSDIAKLQIIQNKIDELNEQIKSKHPKDEELVILREARDLLIQKRKKKNEQINKKRAIYLCLLFHKAVAQLFLEAPTDPEYKFVIHKDFDKENNHADNLAWATRDMLSERHNMHPKVVLRAFNKQFNDGKPVIPNSKLTEMEVLQIKLRLKKGQTLKQIAKHFGVSDMQIHRIKSGENWSHVKLLEELRVENLDNKA